MIAAAAFNEPKSGGGKINSLPVQKPAFDSFQKISENIHNE